MKRILTYMCFIMIGISFLVTILGSCDVMAATQQDGEDLPFSGIASYFGEMTSPIDEDFCMPELVFAHSCTVGNDLSLNYIILKAPLDGFENVRLVVEKKKYNSDGSSYEMQTTTISDYSVVRMESSEKQWLRFSYNGLSAKEMGDELYARIVAEKDGIQYESNLDIYSIKTYAMNMLRKEESEDKLKKLLVDMLNYGTQAQVYFQYNTGNKVNAELDEGMRLYGTTGNPDLTCFSESVLTEEATAAIVGHTLRTGSNIELVYFLRLPMEVDLTNVEFDLSYTSTDGIFHEMIIPYNRFTYDESLNIYTCDIISVAVKDFGCKIEAKVFDVSTNEKKLISDIDYYSIGAYISNQLKNDSIGDELKSLLIEMKRYCVSAAEYFMKQTDGQNE